MNDPVQFLMDHGGPALFAFVFAEQAGLPIPAAPWLLAAGALSAMGGQSPIVAIAVTAVAAVMADSLWFYIGRRGGQRVLRNFCLLSLARNSCVGRTKGLFARHGFQALVAAKFLPGLGTVMPPLAGALGMSAGRFLLFDGVGSLFYGGFYIAAGFVFHNQLQQVMAVLKQLGFSALLLVAAVLTGYIVFKAVRRYKASRRSIREKTFAKAKEMLPELDAGGRASVETLNPLEIPNAAFALTANSIDPGRELSLAGFAAARSPSTPSIAAQTAESLVSVPCEL